MWVPLVDLKQLHPVDAAKFARARGIDDQPVFAWWVPHMLRKWDVIVSSIRKHLRKTAHKCGIEIPTNVKHACRLDQKNKNHF